MQIGSWTIRRTKDVEAEQDKRDKAKAVSARLVELLLDESRRHKATVRRWGLSEGLIEQGADNHQEAPLSPPGGRL